ncbi:MAG TPA: hypothetical protein VFU37_08190 [Pyrinomonadaceae bacterium]|nr:hypothetical protein [Pyrinomonadaceae bacterium]
MNSVAISLVVFACVVGGAVIGLFFGAVLPPDHLSGDSKDVVKVGMGLVGTMTAILLGLLVASAKSFYDTQSTELTEMSAKVILLDRVLAHYGPEAKEARDLSHGAVARILDTMWQQGGRQDSRTNAAPGGAEIVYEKIQGLSPQNDTQHSLQTQALSIAIDLGKTRWLMLEQGATSVSLPLLVALVFWLAVIFCSFGLLAPRNATVVATLCISALSVSVAIFLVLELYDPFGGVVQIPSAPLRSALDHLGK